MNGAAPSTHAALVNQCLRFMLARGAFVFGRFSSTVKGIADVLGCMPDGRFVAIECCVTGHTTTPAQSEFLSAVTRRGGLAIVVYDVADLAEILDREAAS